MCAARPGIYFEDFPGLSSPVIISTLGDSTSTLMHVITIYAFMGRQKNPRISRTVAPALGVKHFPCHQTPPPLLHLGVNNPPQPQSSLICLSVQVL